MTTEFLDLKSILTTAALKGKGKFIKVDPIRLIVEKSNKIDSNSQINLSTNGETVRSSFFEAIESDKINMDFLVDAMNDENFTEKCSGTSLLTAAGMKYRFFWKDQSAGTSSVKSQIQAVCSTSGAARANTNSSSSPIKVNSAAEA